MKARQEAADGFYRHLREWFTAFLPRQRGAAGNTITSCRQTWNMLLGYVAGHHHVTVENVTFAMIDRTTVTGFPGHMQAARSWTAPTRNQRLACIRSFFTYAAAAEPSLAVYLAGLAAIPRLNGPAAAPVKYMTTGAVTALLAAPDPGGPRARQVPPAGRRGRLHRAVGVDRPADTEPAAHVHRRGAGRVLPGR